MKKYILAFILGILVVCFFITLANVTYTVSDNEQVVVTRLGDVVADKTEKGDYKKIPFLDKIHRFKNVFYLSEET